jgi:hypothetical protein
MEMPEDLIDRVGRWAHSVPGMERAARLLAVSPWLGERDFVESCVVLVDADGGEPRALVDWAAVADFLADGPEATAEALGALRLAFDVASKVWHDLGDDREPTGARS